MAKIAYIGAGSRGFARQLVVDILTRPALQDCSLALMDLEHAYVGRTAALARKVASQLGAQARIEATTDRRRALDGADYVVSTIRPSGWDTQNIALQIGAKHGLHIAVGGESGLSGMEGALRYWPLLLAIIHDMERLCPTALFMHYSNPTSILPWALNLVSPIRSIGMCHSVQHTASELAQYIGARDEETGHWVAGINHQAWFLRFEWQGEDAYPKLRQRMREPDVYERDIVRFEMLDFFGYFPTESSLHNSEYVPYFRKNLGLIEHYTNRRGYWASKDWRAMMQRQADQWRKQAAEQSEEAYSDAPVRIEQGAEYVSGIINALEANEPYRFNGNVLNTGLITNLPQGCCVEVPCLVDGMGVHPCYIGDLPPQCAALNRNRIAGDELMVRGLLDADRRSIQQAVALDPLTAAVCTLDQIRTMTAELFAALGPLAASFR